MLCMLGSKAQPYMTGPAVFSAQVCGLKWSPDDREIASGGNDNQLYIWNLNSTSPVIKFSDHNAAVKAIAWSPHQHGLLASGGGTADRCIRFWNSATNTALNCIDTGNSHASQTHAVLCPLPCYSTLCCGVLSCTLCCALPCCAVPCHAVLCCALLPCAVLCHAMLCCALLCHR